MPRLFPASSLQSAFAGGQTIVIADGDNKVVTITNNDITNNPNALRINNATNGNAISINQTGGGSSINITSSSSTNNAIIATAQYAARLVSNNGGHCLELANSGTSKGLRINAAGTSTALEIVSTSTGSALLINTNDLSVKGNNVGIGIVTPTAKLHVVGTILLNGAITISDANNIAIGTTSGTKIGTAASQKIGLWNATPIVQPTTAGAAATFAANTSAIANDTATFDGYTIGQVVKALRNVGILA